MGVASWTKFIYRAAGVSIFIIISGDVNIGAGNGCVVSKKCQLLCIGVKSSMCDMKSSIRFRKPKRKQRFHITLMSKNNYIAFRLDESEFAFASFPHTLVPFPFVFLGSNITTKKGEDYTGGNVGQVNDLG